jgi:hypothetical protein
VNRRRRRRRGRRATDSDASHRYGAIGDRTLCVGVLYAAGVNVDSLTHRPLIERIARSRQEGGLGPL